tara:strand:+ start:56 stop:841 length:786 start_codon:yes stop_codon:yes gene_type:complete
MLGLGLGLTRLSGTFIGGDTTSFITTWRTTTDNETITIPTTGSGYNYDVSTSDGQAFSGETGNKGITFTVAGDYDISISGDFPRIYFNNGGDKVKVINIKQWGNIAWNSFVGAFFGCSNLVGAFTDAPNLSGVSDMTNAFRAASSYDGRFVGWDFNTITDMYAMLYQAASYTQSLASLNIVNVTDMRYLLTTATLTEANYNATLIGWEATLQAYVAGGGTYSHSIVITFGNSEYTGGGAAAAARASLISNFGWTITDGGIA